MRSLLSPRTDANGAVAEPAGLLALLVLPAGFLIVELHLRAVAGPFWQWNLLDPAYFYLLDSLNLIAGNPPGHVAHPGITVDTFNAVVLRLIHLGSSGDEVIGLALAHPEAQLARLSTAYLSVNALVLVLVGYVAYRVFGALLPALVCQVAPFMSTIVLKHAFLPKPEALLVTTTLLLCVGCLAAARTEHAGRSAVGLGVIAGFGLATKVTIVPVLVLPLLILANVRAVAIYGASALVAFFVFFLPGIGGFDIFADWMAHVAMGSGAHGAGPQTVIDLDHYPNAVAKILKRPALKVPLILAFVTLVVVLWRHGRPGLAQWQARLLMGVTVAQVCHVLFVAKQPAAFYLIPSYMLAALSVLLSARLLWAAKPSHWLGPVSGTAVGGVGLAVFLVAQVNGVEKLKTHFVTHQRNAAAIDNARFAHCARVYIYAASSPVFALFLADRVTGLRHSQALAEQYPGNDYWIEDWYDQREFDFRNWQGTQDFAAVRSAHQCLFIRGNRRAGLETFLRAVAPDMSYRTDCAAPPEMIATVNVDCKGEAVQ